MGRGKNQIAATHTSLRRGTFAVAERGEVACPRCNTSMQLHRNLGPAIIVGPGQHIEENYRCPSCGHEMKFSDWYLDGQLHRDDGPAVTAPANWWLTAK